MDIIVNISKSLVSIVRSQGLVIFFEKNKVLGVEPNRVLNILEGI
jgi:hypothetical protein